MFDIPNAKRVRREDLYSASPSPAPTTPDENLEARLKQQYEILYRLSPQAEDSLSETKAVSSQQIVADDQTAEEVEAFEFRLFAKPVAESGPGEESSRIVIKSPSPPTEEPGFIQPRRPDSYYFAAASSPEQRTRYAVAALPGEAIRAEQARKWPGCELPWKVVTIRVPSSVKVPISSSTLNRESTNRKRMGKKRRIILRKKVALLKVKEAVERMSVAEKEAAEREKRTRRNREKKVKRKEKEKVKKAIVAKAEV